MPPTARPMISWTAEGAVFCLIEWQFGQPKGGDWEGSGFALVRDVQSRQGGGGTMQMRAPFGVGRQPHRWRIWAVSGSGDVVRSGWRTIVYTN